MKSYAIAVGLFAALASAAQFTNTGYNVKQGQSFTLTWANATGDVSLILKDGESTNLKTVKTLASGLTDSSYSFTPDWTTGSYAFEIDDDASVNYSPQFDYEGTAPTTTAKVAASTTMATATSTDGATITSEATSAAADVTSAAVSSGASAVSSAASVASGAAKTATAEGSQATNPASSNANGLVAPMALAFLAVGIAAL